MDGPDNTRAAIDAQRAALTDKLRTGDRLGAADTAAALGRMLDEAHLYAEAADAHGAAFDLRNELLGPDDRRTNESCYEVGELSRVLCRFEEAEYFLTRALDVELCSGNPRGGDFPALLHNNLAEVHTSLGRYEYAGRLFDAALRLRVEAGGEDGELAWRTRLSMARWQLRQGGHADQVAVAARAALEKVAADARASWYLMLADALLAGGDATGAESIYAQFHEQVPVSTIGRGMPLEAYLEMLRGLTLSRMAGKAWLRAAEGAASVVAVAERELGRLVQVSAEVQVIRALHTILDVQSLWLTALWRSGVRDGAAIDAAFGLVQMTKGLRTRYVRMRQPGDGKVEQLRTPENEARLEARQVKIREIAAALVAERLAAPDTATWETSFATIAKRAQLRQLERESAAGVGDLEADFDLRPIGGAAIPAGSAGIEILLVHDVASERLGVSPASHRYMAFALGGATATPVLFDIGLADNIDQAIGDMRRSIEHDAPASRGGIKPDWMRLAAFLGKKLLQACWVQIQGASHLAVGPDGAFSAIPFELLVGPAGTALGEQVSVSYCMRLAEFARRAEPILRGRQPIVLAGPDFDLPRAFTAKRTAPTLPAGLTAGLLPPGGFSALPAAAAEGVQVARMLGVDALSGPWALLSELLNNGSPEIIHIATHGFVLPASAAEDRFGLAAPIGNALDQRSVLDDPLQRSGLVFAGANAALQGRSLPALAGDGIVYASTVQQLNLQQTDLVVLTACRSGLGELTQDDGAHGLRRAFLAAGCRTVVAALWDVPDESSRALSTAFYEGVLAGRSRLDALHAARDVVRALHPDDPVHWAGFVLDGETGPLRRFSPLSDLRVASASFREWGINDGPDRRASMARLAARIAGVPARAPALTVSLARKALADAELPDTELDDLLAWHADLANHLGDHERAVADFQRSIDRGCISAGRLMAFRFNIAKIRQQNGQLTEAIAGYTALLAEGPDPTLRAMGLVNRSMAYYLQGDLVSARRDVEAVIADAQAPADQRRMALVNRAQIGEDADPEGALRDCDAALQIEEATAGETLHLRAFRVALLVRLGRHSAARGEIDELLAGLGVTDDLHTYLCHWREQASAAR